MQVTKHTNHTPGDLKVAMKAESPMTRNYFFLLAYSDHNQLVQLWEGKHPKNPWVPCGGWGQELRSHFPLGDSNLSREQPRQGVGLGRKGVGQTEPMSKEINQGREK